MTNKNSVKISAQDRSDLVAYWSVPLLDGAHTVEFEHGTTSGKRVLRVDGNEIFRKDWMFKLVGDINFTIGKQESKCELRVDPVPPFSFAYSLFVDGKPLDKFAEKQKKTIKVWSVIENGKRYGIVFSKQTQELWINGKEIESDIEFVESGTEIMFSLGNLDASIHCSSEQGCKELIYNLFVNNKLIVEDSDDK